MRNGHMQLLTAARRLGQCVSLFLLLSGQAAESAWDLLGADAAAHVRALSARASGSASIATDGNTATNVVSGSGVLGADTLTSMDALDDKHRLGVGDRLSLRIVEDREEAKETFVTDAGELEVAYVGRVMAKGRTCKELAVEIKKLLEEEYYHKATVILAIDMFSRTRGRVYVVGQVRVTGAIEIPTNETFTLSKAILIAGGFTDFADKKKVRLTRRRAKDSPAVPSQTVDVQEILEQGRTEKDPELEPDDLVFVPARWLNL